MATIPLPIITCKFDTILTKLKHTVITYNISGLCNFRTVFQTSLI